MNILTSFKKRPLSYSCLSSFDYNPEVWYDTYILGNKQVSKEMTFGTMIAQKKQDDPTFLPQIPRCPLLQYKMEATFNGIPMIGKPDAIDLDNFILRDYKTGKKDWDKKRADETDQLTMYLMLVYIIHKIPPEKFTCWIDWMQTMEDENFNLSFVEPIEENIKHFKTKRTMADILHFGKYINDTVKKMQEFINKKEIA